MRTLRAFALLTAVLSLALLACPAPQSATGASDAGHVAQVPHHDAGQPLSDGGLDGGADAGLGLSVVTSALPGAVVGEPYSAYLEAAHGAAPATWTLGSGASLPAGLSLSTGGELTGTPTAAGAYAFEVVVTDHDQASARGTVTLIVSLPVLTVGTASVPDGTAGVAFSTQLSANSGQQPYTWQLAGGSLPPGLALSSAGLLSGTPSAPGTFSYTVLVSDSSSPANTAHASYTQAILPAGSGALTITTTSLPSGVEGVAYQATLAAANGTPPLTWAIASGSLPAGLSLATDTGIISGTPSAAGAASFTVQVTDSASTPAQATAPITLTISPPLQPGVTSLPDGVVGSAYSGSITATGGTAPYTLTVTSGALPVGLSLDSGSGAVTGTPSAAGTSTFTVRIGDSSSPQQIATVSLAINVAAPLQITTVSLADATQGLAYSQPLSASGGTAPITWAISAGALPGGITLDGATGTLSGTPSATSSSSITLTATDSSSPAQAASAQFTLLVNPPGTLSVTTTTLPGAVVGTSYSASLAAQGGTPAYTWSIASGALPAGLTLNASTGALSGTPSAVGSASVTFQVADSAAHTATRAFTLSVVGALAVTSSSLPDAVVGAAYSASLSASGGTPAYTWALASGTLPGGLSLAPSGAITGTPTAAGSATVTVRTTDSGSPAQNATGSLTITVHTLLAVSTASLPAATAGSAYSAGLAASGGTTPYAWAVTTGALPAGLSLSSAGQITGTPSASGSTTFTVTATDAASPAQSASRSLTLNVLAPLTITTTGLPGATATVAYSTSLAASGGATPYAWSVSSGSLPAGLSLSSSGQLSGTPTAPGTANFTVQVTDSGGAQATQALSLTVSPSGVLAVATTSLPDGVTGASYSASLTGSGGTPAYTWAIASGSLPTGLSLSASTGALSGTPSSTGTFSFTAQVTDSANPPATASQALSIRISGPLTITSASLPGGVTGAAYSATLTGSGGQTPYTWSVASGSLPGGLTLDGATGTLSGTPSAAGTFSFTVKLADGSAPQLSTTQALSITVTGPLTITTVTLPNGALNVNYNQNVQASGGTAPYAWSISSGSLPPGLSLGSSTGSITGKPSSRGTFTFTVRATDSSSPAQQVDGSFSIAIH